jgi:hypothetical protein
MVLMRRNTADTVMSVAIPALRLLALLFAMSPSLVDAGACAVQVFQGGPIHGFPFHSFLQTRGLLGEFY